MESSYMGGLDGSDPLGKAVIWSRTEDVDHLDDPLRQHEQEQVPYSPLPTRSSSTSTTTSTSTEDTETTTWDDMGLDSNSDTSTCFHVLYAGHGSPPTKSKVRHALAQAMSTYFTTIQQHRQRQLWRQQQQQQGSTKSLPQQRFNVVTSGALDTDTYEDNGLALWETDATWTLPSMSILLSPLVTGDISDDDHENGDDGSLFVHYLPQTLHSELLPQLQVDNYRHPPIDLVIYFCNQRRGPLEQDFAALSKLHLPVLPLIIHSPSSSSTQPALPIPAPSSSDPDYPPSLSSSFSSSSDQMITIQSKSPPSSKQSATTNKSPSPSSWTLLRNTLATYLQQYHIHCINVTEIHPEVPGFITNVSSNGCPDGAPSSLCHIMSADEIMHVNQFTSLDTRVTYKLMVNVRKYNERWDQVKLQHQPYSRLLRYIYSGGWRRQWQPILLLVVVVLGAVQWMHMLTWTYSDQGTSTAPGGGGGGGHSGPLTSGSRSRMFDGDKTVVDQHPLSALPHMTMASGYEYPDADMYHHLTLKMTANSVNMDTNQPDEERGANYRSGSSNGKEGASRQDFVINQAQLVWDQGGVWTLTKSDWTAHVPSPCKMNWDTDMNLTLWIDTNTGDGGHWQKTTHQFTLAWIPCHQHQRPFEYTYYPHDDRGGGGGGGDDIEAGLGGDIQGNDGSISYFSLTPYQHDILRQWWLHIKAWTRNGMHGLVDGVKKLQMMTDSLYVYLMQ